MKWWISGKTSLRCFKSWLKWFFFWCYWYEEGNSGGNFYFFIWKRNPLLGAKSLELQIFHICQHWCPSPQLTLSRSKRYAKEEISFLPESGALTKCLSQILCQSSFIPLCCTTDKGSWLSSGLRDWTYFSYDRVPLQLHLEPIGVRSSGVKNNVFLHMMKSYGNCALDCNVLVLRKCFFFST